MAATTIIAEMTKEIKYDRAAKDYACYLNGELIGYESTYSQAETFISNTYYEMLTHASAPAAEPLPAVDVETWQGEGEHRYSAAYGTDQVLTVLSYDEIAAAVAANRPLNF